MNLAGDKIQYIVCPEATSYLGADVLPIPTKLPFVWRQCKM